MKNEYAIFAPAGNSESFGQKYKSLNDVPKYLTEMGLDAFEYQCGRGVKISKESATKFGKLCAEENIMLSLHAPYFISLSSVEEQKRIGSARYFLESAAAISAMGHKRIIVHSGSCGKLTREKALEYALETLRYCRQQLDENGFSEVVVCPETMGKINQLGTLEEVIELCKTDDRMVPCIDFGHLNARTLGGIKTKEDYKAIFDTIQNELGFERLKNMHVHFSKIEFTSGGEKKHLRFDDTIFGPSPEYFIELVAQLKLTPYIVCESDGTQAEDAMIMKNYYLSLV